MYKKFYSKMKKQAMLTSCLLLLGATSFAQQPLPYSCNFDSPGGWTVYAKGDIGQWGNWDIDSIYGSNELWHDYYDDGGLAEDWASSPSIDLSAGGLISFKLGINCINGYVSPGDTINLYVLKGSPDPALATSKTLVAFLAVNSMLLTPTQQLNDTSGIVIQPTTGPAYLSFQYTDRIDWFQLAIDDISVTAPAPPPAAVGTVANDKVKLQLYPNPAYEILSWKYENGFFDKTIGQLIDASGRILNSFQLKDKQLNIQNLAPGLYLIKAGDQTLPFSKL